MLSTSARRVDTHTHPHRDSHTKFNKHALYLHRVCLCGRRRIGKLQSVRNRCVDGGGCAFGKQAATKNPNQLYVYRLQIGYKRPESGGFRTQRRNSLHCARTHTHTHTQRHHTRVHAQTGRQRVSKLPESHDTTKTHPSPSVSFYNQRLPFRAFWWWRMSMAIRSDRAACALHMHAV